MPFPSEVIQMKFIEYQTIKHREKKRGVPQTVQCFILIPVE